MKPARLGYVGPASSASAWLMEAIARVGRLEALCDANAERDAGRWRARWTFADAESMLHEAEVEGVVVASPVTGRAAVVKQFLSGGAGVLILGVPGAAKDGGRIDSLGRVSSRPVFATSAIRFSPAMRMARRLIESGKIGAPISISIESTWRGGVRDVEPHAGSVSADQVFEAMDVLSYLLGPTATMHSVHHCEGAMAAQGRTHEGAVVSIMCHSSGPAEAVGLEIDVRSRDGSRLTLDRNGRLACGNGSRADAVHGPSLASVDPCSELGYEGLLSEFVSRMRTASGGMTAETRQIVAAVYGVLGGRGARRGDGPSPNGAKLKRPLAHGVL